MREWHITPNDPMLPRIAADARSGHTVHTDDQVWQLRLGQPDEPALSLETRYGGRVGLARLVPIWSIGPRQIYEAQSYHTPPILTAFAPDYFRLRAELTPQLALTYEFWTMESQIVGGRCTCHNTSDQPQTLHFNLLAQAMREQKSLGMFLLTLETGQVALQIGRLTHLQPVLVLEDAEQTSAAQARLGRSLTIQPAGQATLRWVLGSLPDRATSVTRALSWLQSDWTRHLDQINKRAAAQPQIETGHPDWDLALAWSQQLVLRSFLAATGSLPHPSFVMSRKTNQGYAVKGVHSGGFAYPWGGQTIPDALSIAATVAYAAPDLAQGLVWNFLAVQRDDGWIDAKPGSDGQRVHVLAPPLLATLAYTVYHITRNTRFLEDCFERLLAFFWRWFEPDLDLDQDSVPEWSHLGQGAFADSPTLAQGRHWAQGVDISAIEAPDLITYLIREGHTLLRIAEELERTDRVPDLRPRLATLQAVLDAMWNPDTRRFCYRDRDAHTCPTGEVVFTGQGDQALREHTTLSQPSRLIVRAAGGAGRKPALSCTIEGVNSAGEPANETVSGAAFDWYRNRGAATTHTVWHEITYLKFDGLSRVYKIEVNTVDLSQHDQALLIPLWSPTLDENQTARVFAMLTDPEQYWRAYGISGGPATSPTYDPAHQNGCGGMWPAWNARFAEALLDRDYTQAAVDLFQRVIAAQCDSLKEEQTFRSFYNPDTGTGMGDTDVIDGAVSLGWFGRLFGAHVLTPGEVVITGPFAFKNETMRWQQHGVVIERQADGSTITFPTGHTVALPAAAEPQSVRDPNVRPTPPQPDMPSVTRPDEGLLPEGD